MIWDSYPWRRELLRRAERIEARKHQQRWRESSFAALELDVMTSAYAIRKLLEAQTKVPQSVSSSRVEVTRYPSGGGIPDLMNWDQVDRWYDLDSPSAETLPIATLCDLIIHSWVFAPTLDSVTRGLDGLLLNSDRTKAHLLYEVDIESFVELLRRVATEEVIGLSMKRDADGQWVVVDAVSSKDGH